MIIKNQNLQYIHKNQKEENINNDLLDIEGLGDEFFWDLTPKTKATKSEVNKWGYIKLKCFCTVNEIINKMKR